MRDAADAAANGSSAPPPPPPLPRAAHPTAQAFFDALDNRNNTGCTVHVAPQNGQKTANRRPCGGEATTTSNISKQAPSSSDLIRQRTATLGWRSRHSQSEMYPIHLSGCRFSVQQVQRGEIDGTYGTGATVWPAAMVLIKYLERQQQQQQQDASKGGVLQNRTVVDLGSGTAVTSVAAALLGASSVYCTDGEESVVTLARDNVRRVQQEQQQKEEEEENDSKATATIIAGCPIHVQKYWWGTDDPPAQAHVILVADCVLPKLYPIGPLVQAIDECLLNESNNSNDDDENGVTPVAILSYEHRYFPEYDPRTKFQELAEARNLHVESVPQEEMDPVYRADDIEIWRLTRNR